MEERLNPGEILQTCNQKMQEAEMYAGFTGIARQPNRPVLLVFLGEHDPSCIEEVRRTLEMNWPQHSNEIICKTYATPEAFQKAIQPDQEGNIELEDCIIEQCEQRKGFRTTSDVIIGYFLNLTQDGIAFADILNQPFDTPVGGAMTRFVFAVGRFSRSKEKRTSCEVLNRIRDLANENQAVWRNTHVVSLGDYMYGGGVIAAENKAENYAIAVEMLLIYNSVGSSMILPYATVETGHFITGSFKRIGKPRNRINQSVLFRYLERCQKIAAQAEEEHVAQRGDLDRMYQECVDLTRQLFDRDVMPKFPKEEDMRGFPNEVVDVSGTDELGGEDRTCGVWTGYRKLYFEEAVKNSLGDPMKLSKKFEWELGKKNNCAQIQQLFEALKEKIEEQEMIPFTPRDNSFREYGIAAAVKVFNELTLSALKQAIEHLQENARGYQECIARIQGRIHPNDEQIQIYYSAKVDHYLGMTPELLNEMRSPCAEFALKDRMLSFYEKILLSEPDLKLPFEQELQKRTDVATANQRIQEVLLVTPAEMESDMRMHIRGADHLIGDYVLVNPKVVAGEMGGTRFEVGRTDCLDRIAFYAYSVSTIL